jgi:hypothetical protein
MEIGKKQLAVAMNEEQAIALERLLSSFFKESLYSAKDPKNLTRDQNLLRPIHNALLKRM